MSGWPIAMYKPDEHHRDPCPSPSRTHANFSPTAIVAHKSISVRVYCARFHSRSLTEKLYGTRRCAGAAGDLQSSCRSTRLHQGRDKPSLSVLSDFLVDANRPPEVKVSSTAGEGCCQSYPPVIHTSAFSATNIFVSVCCFYGNHDQKRL
jgi:hypothetical protein